VIQRLGLINGDEEFAAHEDEPAHMDEHVHEEVDERMDDRTRFLHCLGGAGQRNWDSPSVATFCTLLWIKHRHESCTDTGCWGGLKIRNELLDGGKDCWQAGY